MSSDLGVDALMRQVRQEVERRRLESRMRDGHAPSAADDQLAASWQALNEAIVAAESSTLVGMRLPPMTQMRGWRRRIAEPAARLILRIAQLVTRDQSAFNQLILGLVRWLSNAVNDRLTATSGRLDTLTDGLARAIAQSRPVPELVDAGARTSAEVRALHERIAGMEDAAARLEASTAEAIRQIGADLAVTLAAERLRAQHLQTQVTLQERRIATLAEPARRRPAKAGAAGATAPAGDAIGHLSDAFYVGFEDRFRGSRDGVKERVRVYLPIVRDAGAGTSERPILDVGCGRGEWLEVLNEEGLVGHGLDLNEAMVHESRERGLDVARGDVLEHLRGLPDGSVGAVTGMHLIEHVRFPVVVEILDECRRVLQPGGVAIFETPNPRNLVVGACRFYIDPTHRTPLHPDTMAFVAEHCGLVRVRILELHPVENGRRLPDADSPVAQFLNEQLFGPQDFAVVGYRD